MNLAKIINDSKNPALIKKLGDLGKWSKLRRTKADLELFLQFNVVQLKFKTLKGKECEIICTSNSTLINVFNMKLTDKTRKIAALIPSTGIKTKDLRSVDTYDLVNKTIKTVPLNWWFIVDFYPIEFDNILVLDEILKLAIK
jgi:hypothetical protein